ncbi:hypothetical protein HDU67_009488, partial [Dinochytrium kinnereticum]
MKAFDSMLTPVSHLIDDCAVDGSRMSRLRLTFLETHSVIVRLKLLSVLSQAALSVRDCTLSFCPASEDKMDIFRGVRWLWNVSRLSIVFLDSNTGGCCLDGVSGWEELAIAIASLPRLSSLRIAQGRLPLNLTRLFEIMALRMPNHRLTDLSLAYRTTNADDIVPALLFVSRQIHLRRLALDLQSSSGGVKESLTKLGLHLVDESQRESLTLEQCQLDFCFSKLHLLEHLDASISLKGLVFIPDLLRCQRLSRLSLRTTNTHIGDVGVYRQLASSDHYINLTVFSLTFTTPTPISNLTTAFRVLEARPALRVFRVSSREPFGLSYRVELRELDEVIDTIPPRPQLRELSVKITRIESTWSCLTRLIGRCVGITTLVLGHDDDHVDPASFAVGYPHVLSMCMGVVRLRGLEVLMLPFDLSENCVAVLNDGVMTFEGLTHVRFCCRDPFTLLNLHPLCGENSVSAIRILELDVMSGSYFNALMASVLKHRWVALQIFKIRTPRFMDLRVCYPDLLNLLPNAPPTLQYLHMTGLEEMGCEEIRFLMDLEERRRGTFFSVRVK